MSPVRILVGVVVGGAAVGAGAGAFVLLGPDEERLDWGLHIVFFSVGQADAMVLVTPEGEAVIVDAGRRKADGHRMAEFLRDAEGNGVRRIDTVKLAFATHYDQDHINGFAGLVEAGIVFDSVFDQGLSAKREASSLRGAYHRYVSHLFGDDAESPAGRTTARPGMSWYLGNARIRVLAANGNTYGRAHDIDLDPATRAHGDFDENCGSIALLIRLGQFELYTAGDQTSDDWRGFVDAEMAVVRSTALGNNRDIDVFKVNHHGSESSNGPRFLHALDPEVAIVSSDLTLHGIPKAVTIQELTRNDATVYITGNALDEDGRFTDSPRTTRDDEFVTPPEGSVLNDVGDIHIYVSRSGDRYVVVIGDEAHEYSALDRENPHAFAYADTTYPSDRDVRLDPDSLPRCRL